MPDMEAYDAFSRKVFLDDPNVKSFTTHVVLDRVKTGCTVPIELYRIDGKQGRR
jgi:DNA-binding Lrp family transcriptional regulator